MQKAYSRINWENYPSTETPLNETNLNRIDLALDTVDDRVVTFDTTKANQTDLLTCVDGITFNTSSGILTISFKNGTTATIDTGLAKLAVNFDYDDDPTSPHYQQLILEMKDGTYKYIDLSSMITQFEFDNTSTVVFNVDAQTGHISAVVPDGSITANKLDPNVVVTMQAIEDAAEADALKSEGHAIGKQNGQDVGPDSPYYHNNAKYYCEQAQGGGSGGHVIKDDTQTFVQRTGLKFSGKVAVTDDAVGGNTVVTIEAGGAVPHLIVISESGSTVKAVKGQKEIIAIETSTDHYECDLEMDDPQDIYGTWTIHAVLNGDDEIVNLVVDTIKVYLVDDEHFHADIIVTYPNGATVSCTKEGMSPMYATSSPYTFTVHSTGTYTIEGSRDGVTETEYIVIRANGQTEYVTLELRPDGSTATPTDSIQILLRCAGIEDKDYTTMHQLLADDASLRKVLTDNNAIDYLVRSLSWVNAVTGSQSAMGYIGAYDYASNTLLDDSDWKTGIFGSAYLLSVINVSTPTMTSNTEPKGECGGNGYYNQYYYAFNKSLSDFWSSNNTSTTPNARIYYKFDSAKKCIAVKFAARQDAVTAGRPINYRIETSDDGTTWDSPLLTISNESAVGTGEYITHTFDNSNAKKYYSMYCTLAGGERFGLAELDFLGREVGGVQSWLKAGGIINKSYTTLAEVLADTTTLLALMTNNNAIDYLVTAKAFIDGICANETAMSYIGSYDYCANNLLADSAWNTGIQNSTYFESVDNVKVPIMTSDTSPKGECFGTTNNVNAYMAFNGNSADNWGALPGNRVGYDFGSTKKIFKVVFDNLMSGYHRVKDYKIQGTNDREGSWTDIVSDTAENKGSTYTVTNIVNSNYRYYGMYITNCYAPSNYDCIASGLNFYGRENGSVQSWLRSAGITDKSYTTLAQIASDITTLLALVTNTNANNYLKTAYGLIDGICANETIMKAIGSYDACADSLLDDATWNEAIENSSYYSYVINASVPTMTSATTPSGQVVKGSEYSSNYAYNAFDKNASTQWASNSTSADWIGYIFTHKCTIKALKYNPNNNKRGLTYKIQGTNDGGSNWVDVINETLNFNNDGNTHVVPVNNNTPYDGYRVNILTSTQAYLTFTILDFMCRDNGGVQNWLRAGNITDKTYTTLAEVLADTTTLSALIASQDAVDYLVTAKGFIDGIVADATAMSYIGLNNYCANMLLNDAEWANAIAKATNIESVSNIKVPTMTSATTPSGTVISNGVNYATGYDPWKAFRGATTGNLWCLQTALMGSENYCGYIFTSAVKIFGFKMYRNSAASFTPTIKVQGSTDGTSWLDIYVIPTKTYANRKWHIFGFPLSNEYTQFRVDGVFNGAGSDEGMAFQFYGREDV